MIRNCWRRAVAEVVWPYGMVGVLMSPATVPLMFFVNLIHKYELWRLTLSMERLVRMLEGLNQPDAAAEVQRNLVLLRKELQS